MCLDVVKNAKFSKKIKRLKIVKAYKVFTIATIETNHERHYKLLSPYMGRFINTNKSDITIYGDTNDVTVYETIEVPRLSLPRNAPSYDHGYHAFISKIMGKRLKFEFNEAMCILEISINKEDIVGIGIDGYGRNTLVCKQYKIKPQTVKIMAENKSTIHNLTGI